MSKKKIVVRKPSCRNGIWGVSVCEGLSPLSPEIEFIACTNRKEAFDTYGRIKKQTGEWF